MATEMDLDRMTEEAAARILGIKPQTLSVWRCTGRYGLPFSKVGRAVRYSRKDLEAWLAERTGTNSRQISAAVSA